jgi:ADP-heptose:LPS heptosyltransferase
LLLSPIGDAPKVGVYTSAYGNSRHWGFWDWEMWRDFLKSVAEELPKETYFIFIGAEYDLAISEYVHKWLQENGYNSLDLVGKLEIGGTIEVIRELDYLFSFPSGIGFLADVVNTPNTMWFPSKLDRMRYTFVDPVNRDIGRTVHLNFDIPEDSAKDFVKGPGLLQFQYRLRKRKWKGGESNGIQL